MKNVLQLSHEDLLEMIALKLSVEGLALRDDFAVEFVTPADGRTSVLVTGAVPEKDLVKELEKNSGPTSLKARTKKKPKAQTPAQAAMDILGGSGGVLSRSDALGQGVAGDKRRG